MESLLKPLTERKSKEEVAIQFFEAPEGDRKASIIRKVPIRAVNILQNPYAIVAAMPDLYPLNKEVPHQNVSELTAAIHAEFNQALKRKGLEVDRRYQDRFKVFCFKYELEALVLAAERALAKRLDLKELHITWRKPVEDQNNDNPPKHVINDLSNQHGKHFVETVDVPVMLAASDYHEIADACPQCFKPFVEFLENLSA